MADSRTGIDSLVSGCGFAPTKYNPSMDAAVTSITVDATAPTDKKQLTTTILGNSKNAAPAPTAAPKYMYAGAAVVAAAAML